MPNDGKIISDVRAKINAKLQVLAEKIALDLRRATIEQIDSNKMNATGQMRRGVDAEIKNETERIIIEVFDNMGYSYYAHQGTRPHFPPIYAIRDWVRIKGLAANYTPVLGGRYWGKSTIKRYSGKKAMDDYYKVDRIACAIAWKIYKRGTAGVKFFDLALKQSEGLINQRINEFKIA